MNKISGMQRAIYSLIFEGSFINSLTKGGLML